MPRAPRNKTMTYAIVSSLVVETTKLAFRLMEKEPRLCPQCAYRMVSKVGKKRGRKGKAPITFWRCSACAARYKTVDGDTPFRTPTAEEWTQSVRTRFPR